MPGLRQPQVGALHAIAAHFSVGTDFDAATVVLPTGTGKTETMLAAQIYLRLPRTLVLVPSDALRNQIARKFISLGVLPDARIIPVEMARPRVAIINAGIRKPEDAAALLLNANVIIALPNSLEASTLDALTALCQGCTDLIVDEAHHITARTWQNVRTHFSQKRILQFTATPFRRDGKRVDGKIIFNYKLGDAQAAGYYRPINLRTIEEYGDQNTRDYAIAVEALAALRRDRDELGLDHLLMARSSSKERAAEIVEIYERLAPHLKPISVFSGPGRAAANRAAIESLRDRSANGSRVVVCVDMLGEGFDLPNLKIAALHDTHKSLAVALQFIGRFTRQGTVGQIGEATVVTNLADADAEEKLADLYAEGADWDRLIKRLSEQRVEQELRLQDVVLALKESGDLHSQLSLWNLRPSLSAQFFRTQCSDWNPLCYTSVLPGDAKSWHAFSEKDDVLVAVICRDESVGWGNYQNLVNTIYDLVILRWDRNAGALCLYASDYRALRSEKMAKAVTDDNTTLISGPSIFNILNNVELPLVKNLGSSRIGAISFTSYFGPNVTEGLASIEKAESELNNIACLGYEDGERVLWGGAQRRGKVWQQKGGTIADWMTWTLATWNKLVSKNELDGNITRDFLRPVKLAQPYGSCPISVQWGEQAQMRINDRQFVLFGDTVTPIYAVDLELGEPQEDGSVCIQIISEFAASEYRFRVGEDLPGGYLHEHVSGPPVRFRLGTEGGLDIVEYLQRDPFVIRYVDGTYSYNCYHVPARLDAGLYDRAKLECWDWSGVPLNKESIRKSGEKATIQYRTFEHLEPEYDVVFNDDGCGEAADLICIKDADKGSLQLAFVHCKGAHGGQVSQDIRNFYTICGQAQKSIVAKHAGLPSLYHDLRRRQENWMRDGASRFLKGDMKKLAYFREKARRCKITFEMVLVQPGASIKTITDPALRLLATTELYLVKTTDARFRVVLSE
jgi:superfamily II DNA or RNA helicase